MLEVFGPDGLIARAHPEYEYRPGQIEMARAVMRAFEEKRHLIVEAGTGTGKTLAYLVPAVAAALGGNGRVIVSTGTKNLQEQLMEKDIPFLQSVLPKPFSATYMKGRNNYLCLNRLARAQSAPVLEGLDEVDYFEEVCHWSRGSETGDRAELVAVLGYARALAGDRAGAQQILRSLCGRRDVPALFVALVHAGLGEKDQAMELLARSVEKREPGAMFFHIWPEFDSLRSDPRYKELLKKMNLPE